MAPVVLMSKLVRASAPFSATQNFPQTKDRSKLLWNFSVNYTRLVNSKYTSGSDPDTKKDKFKIIILTLYDTK